MPSPHAAASHSKRKMITGALVGFGVGAILGTTIGKEACQDGSKWQCVALGGGMGAAIGILIARK
jgi:hypothetical protein